MEEKEFYIHNENGEQIPLNDKNLIENFSSGIKNARINKGLSQKKAAELLNISAPLLSAYEKGEKKPSFIMAYKLSLLYGISVNALCSSTPDTYVYCNFKNYGSIINLIMQLFVTTGINASFGDTKDGKGWYFMFEAEILDDFLKSYYDILDLINNNGTLKQAEKSKIYIDWANSQISKFGKIKLTRQKRRFKREKNGYLF